VGASAMRPPPPRPVPSRAYVVQQPLPRQEVVIVGPQSRVVQQTPFTQQPVIQQVVQQPALAIAAVELPSTLIENRGSTTFYAVDVTPEGPEAQWRVFRRYNDFHDLQQSLTCLSPGLSFPGAPFPSKSWFKCAGTALEVRRRALELWLRRVVEHPNSRGTWGGELRQFFEAGRQTLMPAPPAHAVAQQAPLAPQTSSSAPSAMSSAAQPAERPQPAAAAGDTDAGQVLQIDIPAGVAAGQLLAVAVPDGRELHFPVPEGSSAGSTLQLWFDPAVGTLRPLT